MLPQFYSYPDLWEGADSVGGQLHGDKECPFSGVTNSGRVWRKVPESDARSVSSSDACCRFEYPDISEGFHSVGGQLRGERVTLQWRNRFWQSFEQGAGKGGLGCAFDREAQQVGDNRWHPREQLQWRQVQRSFMWCRGKSPLLIQNTGSLLLSMNNIEICLTAA